MRWKTITSKFILHYFTSKLMESCLIGTHTTSFYINIMVHPCKLASHDRQEHEETALAKDIITNM